MPSHAPGPDPGSPPALSRRRVLADGSRGLLALALIGTAVTACGSTGSSGPDPLEAELIAAEERADLKAELESLKRQAGRRSGEDA